LSIDLDIAKAMVLLRLDDVMNHNELSDISHGWPATGRLIIYPALLIQSGNCYLILFYRMVTDPDYHRYYNIASGRMVDSRKFFSRIGVSVIDQFTLPERNPADNKTGVEI
jgi:hypothetical protein